MSERLLFTLSTRGSIRLEVFHELLETAAITSNSDTENSSSSDSRRQAARLLDALGHCEFDYERRLVWACRPSLILLPASGLAQAVLAGARTPALIQSLKKAVQQRSKDAAFVSTKQQFGAMPLPSVITISATSIEILKDVAGASGLRWAADQAGALRLAAFSTSRDQVAAGLIYSEKADINWPRKTFSVDHLSFARVLPDADFKLVAYTSPMDHQLQHWLWDGNRAATVDRDWGRFIVLGRNNKQVLLYDSRKHQICVPSSTSLPPLLARALALCSGQAPAPYRLSADYSGISSNQPFHVYAGVPAHIAELVGNKLGQRLIDVSCDEDEAKITPC